MMMKEMKMKTLTALKVINEIKEIRQKREPDARIKITRLIKILRSLGW